MFRERIDGGCAKKERRRNIYVFLALFYVEHVVKLILFFWPTDFVGATERLAHFDEWGHNLYE